MADLIDTACLGCGNRASTPLFQVHKNADGVLATPYYVVLCDSCNLVFTHPVPTGELFKESYSTGIYKHSGGRGFWFFDWILNQLQSMRLREIGRICKKRGRLLDIGYGKGRFVHQACKHGWGAAGIEASPSQSAYARNRYGIKVIDKDLAAADLQPASFDVITSWHMLEHLESLEEFLVETWRLLCPGGLLVLEVPNFASWQSRLGKARWFQLDIPRHLAHYTPQVLRKLLERRGFHIVETHTFSIEMGPYGMLQTLLNLAGTPPNWLFRWLKRSIDNGQWGWVLLHGLLIPILGGLALSVKMLAAFAGAGGVIRVLADKIDTDSPSFGNGS